MKAFCALIFSFLMLSMVACSDEDSQITGKWQLRQYEYPNGDVQKVDSVFYNFQKGTFSAICINNSGGYDTFFGRYALLSDKISINLLDGYEGETFEKYLNWEDGVRVFTIINLTSKQLLLGYNDSLSVFRKY